MPPQKPSKPRGIFLRKKLASFTGSKEKIEENSSSDVNKEKSNMEPNFSSNNVTSPTENTNTTISNEPIANDMTEKFHRSISSSSQMTHHIQISSSTSSAVETSFLKAGLSEMKSSLSEMRNVSNSSSRTVKTSAEGRLGSGLGFEARRNSTSSNEPVITYPESPPPMPTDIAAAKKLFVSPSTSQSSIFKTASTVQEVGGTASGWKTSKVTTSKIEKKMSIDRTDSTEEHLISTSDIKTQLPFEKILSVVQKVTTVEDAFLSQDLDDLDQLLLSKPSAKDADQAVVKYTDCLNKIVNRLKESNVFKSDAIAPVLNKIGEVIRRSWIIPTYGNNIGTSLCNTLRDNGGIDYIVSNCVSNNEDIQFASAKLLQQCLTSDNGAYVAENGLDKVVHAACICTKKNASSVDHSRVSTGILQKLFKQSEDTCGNVIRLGGLDAVIFECRKNDLETLRNCASALANLSLFGGADNQQAMINRKVPAWLFPLAFHNDDNIKYYACLTIAVLLANKEIEVDVLKSGTLNLVEPFVTSRSPFEFGKSFFSHANGQSRNWLKKLVPVLSSKREEARNLAAFHFCMEAGIKKNQNNLQVFKEIGAIEPLTKVASSPNAIASKYAADALRLIGADVPHKLSQQVPLWSVEDVREWIKQVCKGGVSEMAHVLNFLQQISFAEYAGNFVESRVDGDLLLKLTEENLKNDIGITNGIRRTRFMRELQNLKKMADYSSQDEVNLNCFLQTIGPEYSIYTYPMLNAGVNKKSIRSLTEEQLQNVCGIINSIHRDRILDSIKAASESTCPSIFATVFPPQDANKLDAFISYRRSTGSQLASLLKVHLQVRGFSVFIDVERLEAGKFDNNLLQSIQKTKNFLLVLSSKALDRCTGDSDCKDWVHREIVEALKSGCNIIPITDNFEWPQPEDLPEDMRTICHFNGVRWIHDYQDACVDKIERFMKGDMTPKTPDNALNANTKSLKLDSTYQRALSNDA